LQQLYALAQPRIGLTAPDRLDEVASTPLAHALADALVTQQRWLAHALTFLEPRSAFHLLRQLPRSGAPTAAALLTAIGDLGQ
jgi:hypothetical protein